MIDEQRSTAKMQMMVLMQAGQRWQEAARIAGVQTSRSIAYRWFQQFRTQGEAVLHDGKHGHIAKMRQPIQEWLQARCHEEPSLPSSSFQQELHATYAHATWARLAPFFQLPGVVASTLHTVSVELRPFNDRQYNRDLITLCQRVNEQQVRLPDGRLLVFSVKEICRPILHEQKRQIA